MIQLDFGSFSLFLCFTVQDVFGMSGLFPFVAVQDVLGLSGLFPCVAVEDVLGMFDLFLCCCTGLGRRTREAIAKWNQMTALRFQTGGRHETSPASLRG